MVNIYHEPSPRAPRRRAHLARLGCFPGNRLTAPRAGRLGFACFAGKEARLTEVKRLNLRGSA